MATSTNTTYALFASNPLPENPSIARCREAWLRRYHAVKDEKEEDCVAGMRADDAYREAMPALLDHESIRDFVACAAHGMLVGTLAYADGTQLLYAAQVALAALRLAQPSTRPPGRPKCLPEN